MIMWARLFSSMEIYSKNRKIILYNVVDYFYSATVAQDYDKFWEGVTSAPVEIFQSEAVTLKNYFTSNQSSVVNAEVRLKEFCQ